MFSSCYKHGTKVQFWIPTRSQTSDLWILHSNAQPLSHRESMVSKACYEICMWHIRISDVDSIMLVSKIRQMVSFELSNEIEWECKGPRFNSAWGLVMLSFSHGLRQDEKHLSLFLYWAQNVPSLFYYLLKSMWCSILTERCSWYFFLLRDIAGGWEGLLWASLSLVRCFVSKPHKQNNSDGEKVKL